MRLIDADALKVDYIVPSTSTGTTSTQYVSLHQIINAPTWYEELDFVKKHERIPVTLTVQPQRGKWLSAGNVKWLRDDGKPTIIECSLCHKSVINNGKTEWNYCPSCGAKMEGQDETKRSV